MGNLNEMIIPLQVTSSTRGRNIGNTIRYGDYGMKLEISFSDVDEITGTCELYFTLPVSGANATRTATIDNSGTYPKISYTFTEHRHSITLPTSAHTTARM